MFRKFAVAMVVAVSFTFAQAGATSVASSAEVSVDYEAGGPYEPFSHLFTADYEAAFRLVDGIPLVVYDDGRGYRNPVTTAQYGLIAWSVWRRLGLASAARDARRAAEWLRRTQSPTSGAWSYGFAYPVHGTDEVLAPGWHSALAQGQAISLLTRLYRATGDRRLLRSARLALRPLRLGVRSGGLVRSVPGGVWFDEYPVSKPYLVLNGHLFTLLGLSDVSEFVPSARPAFRAGRAAVLRALPRFDTGQGSSYYADVSAYGIEPWPVHQPYLPIMPRLLRTIDAIAPHPRFGRYATAWTVPSVP